MVAKYKLEDWQAIKPRPVDWLVIKTDLFENNRWLKTIVQKC